MQLYTIFVSGCACINTTSYQLVTGNFFIHGCETELVRQGQCYSEAVTELNAQHSYTLTMTIKNMLMYRKQQVWLSLIILVQHVRIKTFSNMLTQKTDQTKWECQFCRYLVVVKQWTKIIFTYYNSTSGDHEFVYQISQQSIQQLSNV